jgi:L-threonylcarbamoyladenylate synthase
MQIFDAGNLTAGDFDQILSFLRAGGVIGFPTDTAYGLGADPFSESAVRRIFEIKGRSETKPILVLVDSIAMLRQLVAWPDVSEFAKTLAQRFWPGPLTMILPALATVPRLVTAGTGTIGVRWPNAPFATSLVRAFGKPLTATSANRSSQPSTANAAEVRRQLGMDLEMLIEVRDEDRNDECHGGATLAAPGGSTLLDLTGRIPKILREGPVSRDSLCEALSGNIE